MFHTAVFLVDGTQKKVVRNLAFVHWFKPHLYSHWYGDPATVVSTEYSPNDHSCFIPCCKIACVCACPNLGAINWDGLIKKHKPKLPVSSNWSSPG